MFGLNPHEIMELMDRIAEALENLSEEATKCRKVLDSLQDSLEERR